MRPPSDFRMEEKMRKILLLYVVCAVSANSQYIAEILPTPNSGGRAVAAGGDQIVGNALGIGGGPAVWNGPGHTLSLLSTAGYTSVEAKGVGNGQQVGSGVAGNQRALLWPSLASAPTDLHPSAYIASQALDTDGTYQVGVAAPVAFTSHAILWQGQASTAVDLHPDGYENSDARGVFGGVQIGSVAGGANPNGAVLWRGTAESMEFLEAPGGTTTAGAQGIHGSQVVGELSGGSGSIIWDLNTGTYSLLGQGRAMATNGINQVGFEGFAFNERALVWSGTEASRLDLHQFVPSGVTSSLALGIDENGTIAGWGHLDGVGSVPVIWTPVPEPATTLGLILGIGFLARRRRKRRQ